MPQRGLTDPPHRQPTGQAENPLGKMHLVGLAPEEERAVAALDDGNLVAGQKTINRHLIEQDLLLELVDGEATGAASGRPGLRTGRGATHSAYTCTVLATSSRSPRKTS